MVRPLSRKDIFYSGSVTNLKEYQSQKSLADYRNSVVSLTRFEKEHRQDTPQYHDVESPADPCPCFNLPPAFKSALASMLDVSLLRDPPFMLIGISNLFGKLKRYYRLYNITKFFPLSFRNGCIIYSILLFGSCCRSKCKIIIINFF